jgi:small subunit ribosomal protein S17
MVERKGRKTRVGTVVSNKMDRTIVVAVDRRVRHPMYKRVIRKTSTVVAHDADNQCRIGDIVRIMETRPLSKTKRWRLVEVVTRAPEL